MPPNPSYLRSRQLLATPLSHIKGVGPRLQQILAKANLTTVEDVLYHLPHRYEDRREIRRIAQLRDGRQEVFVGEVLASAETFTPKARKRIYEVVVADGSGQISLKWFHYRKDWMKKRFAVGTRAVFTGEIKRFGLVREVHHPDAEILGAKSLDQIMAEDPWSFGRILPVYPLTEGLSQKVARKIFKQVVDQFAPLAVSPIPADILQRNQILPLAQALAECHWPEDPGAHLDLETGSGRARSALVFDEFFFLELGLALKRRGVVLEPGIAFAVTHKYTRPLAQMLPFRLTAAQRRVLGEIKHDMMAPHPMNRLVQGDVGSGKTIVALMAALVAIENHTQVAVVAPTEILAEQHYLQFHGWLEKLGLRAALLSGSLSSKEKSALHEKIRAGEVDLVVGTHAVLQQGVAFQRLGLGIIDEQHRFGVLQRGLLRHKGENPDILVMTATPIPRTLSLTLYGDLALSVIDELPPGRTPVKTRVLSESRREEGYRLIKKEIEKGRQAYIVYPLVEESEKSELQAASAAAQALQAEVFPHHRVGLLHGRLKPQEKEAVMAAFKNREIDVLVATTVIEVGIDIPNASVMLIEHAERFGLAQLHQLRGRVGRGAEQSHCLLMQSARCSSDGKRRLEVMAETSDGFRIAEADLEIRGPGEFLGTRQAGLPDFRVANLLRDGRMLEAAREEAFRLAQDPALMSHAQYADTRQALMDRWGSRLELATIG
ncbi:ATP-dependent DNA helicase RecG [Geoalkalibacter halelectricus]|uniref:ATP-dependent DNA helicase RecG n=1 Tax=Geoalkalibacter halelectricus TaxID=2847045 RepID=A0ABY5ZPF0_9BACT|nr:ATP-dependent DNA helicase RecG [Geoalkalibacter halelectricus]MDO3379960.1 ATP-dependent DNA helicase RecG [Geoalkalibacter halelectricus]UWZ80513.1 ATP-dependent DNA helicase RecG [Geoalkalibacter halelectricus]